MIQLSFFLTLPCFGRIITFGTCGGEKGKEDFRQFMKPPISFYFISISSFFPPIAHHLDFGLQFMCKAMATCSMSPRSWPRGQGAYLLQYNKISLILKGGRIPILHSSPIKFSTCIHEIKPKGSPQCNLAQTIFLTWLYPSKISNLWGTMSKNCCIQAYLSSIQHKNMIVYMFMA